MIKTGCHKVRGAYSLHIDAKRIRISAGDIEGVNNAVVTLLQMFSLFGDEGLVPLILSDSPSCTVRALLLDLSPYGRVPSLDALMETVEVVAALKLNQLQAFIRVSKDSDWCFTYTKRWGKLKIASTQVWKYNLHVNSSDIMSLHRYCRDRFIDFVPGIDVDGNVRVDDLISLVPIVRKHLACFDNAKLVDDIQLEL